MAAQLIGAGAVGSFRSACREIACTLRASTKRERRQTSRKNTAIATSTTRRKVEPHACGAGACSDTQARRNRNTTAATFAASRAGTLREPSATIPHRQCPLPRCSKRRGIPALHESTRCGPSEKVRSEAKCFACELRLERIHAPNDARCRRAGSRARANAMARAALMPRPEWCFR